MLKRNLIFIGLAAIVLLIAGFIYHNRQVSNAPKAANTVYIHNFSFNPQTLDVKSGTSVTWVNQDSIPHTVTASQSGGEAPSVVIQPGQSYTATFTAVTTYTYHCNFHPTMTGTLSVSQ